MKTVATGGNPPKTSKPSPKGIAVDKAPKPKAHVRYTWHPDNTLTMSPGVALAFIDAEGRVKLTKARDEACDVAESLLKLVESVSGAPYDEMREKLAALRKVGG